MGSWRNVLLSVFVACFFTVAREVQGGTEPWKKSEKSAERGAEVQLPCILISSQCGGLHSIKWYHGNTRIFIFSENVGLTRESNDIATRATMDYDVNTTKTYLRIPNVKLEDEGLYKCEATYLSVNRECNNVQHITLTVNVRPDYVRVIEKDEKINLTSGDVLGPINEGKLVSLRCESGEGKPVPTVEWYKGEEVLKANSSTNTQDGNIGTGSSELQITVGRNELDATFTCKVSSPALDEPLTLDVKLDVHVSPEKMDVKGVVGHVVSGTKILLECIVSAARPPANVTWYNGTELLNDENERLEMFGTNIRNNTHGTSDTDSHLAFTASEYDNGRMFSCVAENSVTVAEGIKPMKEVTIIEVLYPPIVTLRQENITVNETDEFDLFCDYVANPSELKSVKWLLDGEIINVGKNDHYDGGEASFAPLTVRNASSSDMGRYTCILENSVGESTVQDFIDVSVLYKPQVKVTMEPEVPVNEADRLNVSLTCEVVDGNPMTLTTVRWFLDGDLLKELPDCSRNSSLASDGASSTSTNGILVDEISTFCDIDPSKLLLEAVGRSFNGNYACEGRNDAGWGNRSASAPVVVYYKPGPATITYEPKRVVKKGSLNITCSVLDLGRPEVTGFKWFRGSHQISGEESAVLRIESVNLETKANFTCMAFNEAGDGDPATVFIDVAARPDFIKPLNGYAGFAYNSTNVSIECWVECSPICNISWERDGLPMNFDKTELYYQTNVYHPPDQSKNDFESIQSTLVWNMTAWPDGHLHPFRDNENFTCESTGNGIGPGVKSETVFRVEFPPENMTISKKIIDVIVDSIPESVKCSAVAEPEPMFRWFREGSTDVISTDAVHVFKTKVPRRSNGTYICQAYNRHGQNNITTYLNVLFKPECRIDEERIDGEYYLVCSATANPKESDFTWSLKSDNDTLDQIGEIRDGKGYLRLDTSITNFRTYVCVANNSIGFSLPCERGVPARHGRDSNLPWWLQLEGDLLIIIIIVAMVILLAIVICCIVIWLICRRKRAQAKYSNRVVEMEEREHPDGGPPSPTESSRSRDEGSPTSLHPTPAPRWPLKPGVLVHINRAHSLRSGLAGSLRANDTMRIHSGSLGFANDRYRSRPQPSIVRQPIRPFRRGSTNLNAISNKEIVNQRALSAVSIMHDEGMIARANRIRAIFGSQLKEPDAFPGILRDKTAVTYKRIAPSHQQRVLQLSAPPALPERPISLNQIVSRKRKKPGADPSQATNNNHVDSVSESLPEPETKTFYENLPFHGIQTPPNKSNNLYNYQEYYQQHQKHQQQHYQIQQQPQEMQQYGNYNTVGTGLPSGSLSQLTLPLTRSLYHSSIVSPLETSFMPVHAQNHSTVGRQHHHQFGATTNQHHPQNRSEDGRGYVVSGENRSSSNSPPLSLIHGTSDLELSSYALDHQLQQSSRRSASNQQLQHGGRRNERRKYQRKQHSDRNNDRKSKHRSRANAESRLRGGGGGALMSDTSDLLNSITNCGVPIISDVTASSQTTTTTNMPGGRRSAGDTNSALKYNQYRQDLGIPESYKIAYPHYYEDAINSCPSDYRDIDGSSAPVTNGTSLSSNNSGSHQQRERRTNQYVTGTGGIAMPSTPPSTMTINPPSSGGNNTHYNDLANNTKISTKSRRSSSGYARSEQMMGLSGRASNQSPPITNTLTADTTTNVTLLDDTTSSTTTIVAAANAPTTNSTSSSSSATTLSATSSNPPSTHYAELHFRDVGREIDV
ncbi:uncharacterized protein nrm isoform X1 [Venturia canescens]|uniref:uncharacterized protein nrm isoform X1 n=1 Tax=Venturia canescens TaxID=32260 RepID=UPI001C9C33FD|nr:uncharacterized protein LOC122412953 isoform X1 [Venturia canescens]